MNTPKLESADFESTAMPFLGDVARFAISLTRDEAEADDLVQETFLRALRGWHTFRPGSDCKSWLFTICRNAFLRSRRTRNRLVFSEDGDLDAMPIVRAHIGASRLGLGELFDRIDVRPAILQMLETLPEPHHSALVLVDMEGMSYEQAATVLDIPIGTVRSRLYRGRRKIQDGLLDHARDMGLATIEPKATSPCEDTGCPS